MSSINRRQFLTRSLTASGSLLLGFNLPLVSKGWAEVDSTAEFIHHYLEITSDNQFKLIMDKTEMGQGVITGQTTLLGEEAEIHPASFTVVTAPVAEIYNDKRGAMITGGSTSTRSRWNVLRQAGANIRELMLQAAAKKWSIARDQLTAHEGVVSSNSGQSITYGELIPIANGLSLPQQAPLKEQAAFKYIGKFDGSVDATEKSTGSDQYGIDFTIDNMLVAVIERCPTFGGKVSSYDAGEVLAMPGVRSVFEVPSGVAVVCEKYWQTLKARNALKVEWDLGDNQTLSSKAIIQSYRDAMANDSGKELEHHGDVELALSSADAVLEAEYTLPYLAHATMEPMNATAWVQDDRCDIWVPTQGPTGVRNQAAHILGMDRENVFVHTSKYLGGGFGRRSSLEFAMEAVVASKEMKVPIKVVWSREDDTKFSPMRPISVHRFKAGIKDGEITAWQHKMGCESVMQQLTRQIAGTMLPEWLPNSLWGIAGVAVSQMLKMSGTVPAVSEGSNTDYFIPNKQFLHYALDIDLPILFWRSVGHSHNGFLVESFIDELAHAVGQDPYEFRRQRLPADSRLLNVLDLVAEKSAWQKAPQQANRFRGIAAHESFDTFVAQVAEIEIEDAEIKVKKVYCAVDCGVPVNPNNIKKQMKSGIIYGLSAALQGEITIKNGGVEQSNFHDYAPLRMSQTPEIEIFIVPSEEHPSGVGEPGLPPVAAAVANAVFAATGHRLRNLPLNL